jgi:hypothetical protein
MRSILLEVDLGQHKILFTSCFVDIGGIWVLLKDRI